MPHHLASDFFPESRFGGFTRLDGTVAFYSRVNALLQPHMHVIDFGCGRGLYGEDPITYRRSLRILRGKVHRVTGLDVSSAGTSNPFLDQFHQLQSDQWPLPSACADLVLSDNVLEHLPHPAAFFQEACRVLKPGGYLCVRTPNAWNYVAILSRLVPDKSHAAVISKVKGKIQEKDVFPALYRCNTLAKVRRMLTQHGFQGVVYGYEAEPAYLTFSRLTYALGILHQKLAPGILKAVIFAFAQKQ